MASENSQTMVLYALLVVFLMIGAAGLGIMSVILDSGDKEYTHSHEYAVESGTYLGADASGSGRSDYYNESQRDYLYRIETNLSNGSVAFDIICGSDKVPISSIYDKGESVTLDDTQCTWWSYIQDKILYKFAIDEKMVVHQYIVSAQDGTWSFTANLNDS